MCIRDRETSGHGALKENYFLDDGAYLATKIVIRYAQLRRQGRTLADLLEGCLLYTSESGQDAALPIYMQQV